jgi:segregation and condensation protein A
MFDDSLYTIKTDVFEGPLDMLLDLIEKRKLLIHDIALAQVADDYIAHAKNMQQFPTAQAAGFLLVAATLVLIKSKSLLPTLSLTEEEESSIHDLERRLKILKRLREVSGEVKNILGTSPLFFRTQSGFVDPVFAPHESMTVANLAEAMRGLVAHFPRTEVVPEAVVRKVVSIEDMIDNLMDRVKETMQTSFHEFSKKSGRSDATPKEARLHLIVSFLAMLELVKQGSIAARQDEKFSDILLESEQPVQ